MWNAAGIVRDEAALKKGLFEINEIKNLIGDNKVFADFDSYEIRNMLCASEIIINSALKRKNSIGAHFRTDSCQNFEDINMEMEIQNDKIFVK